MTSRRPLNVDALAFAITLAVPGCVAPPAPAQPTPLPLVAAAIPTAAASTPISAPPSACAPATRGAPCGPPGCELFASAEEALPQVLEGRPRVLGIGESHAQKATAGRSSVTKRFTEQLLPRLAGQTSDLVVELMLPPNGCKKAEQAARAAQREVTAPQADTNQDEYVALGEAARHLGVVPDALRPTCDDLAAVGAEPELAVSRMLETIARLSAEKASVLVARLQRVGSDKMVILYGGALHNDVDPKPERLPWSYGPALMKATNGRYVELDIFAPEAIQDTATWRALPWYAQYDGTAFGAYAVLFHPAAASWVLILPKSAP